MAATNTTPQPKRTRLNWIRTRGYALLKPALRTPAIIMLIVVGLSSYFLEDLQDHIALLRKMQLAAHKWICSLIPRQVSPDHVAIVEIDDKSFWSAPFSVDALTKRK